MKCMNCGAELNDSAYCPNCGCDVSVQKQAIVLSGLFYNQGLEKAQVRDLSGAIELLKRSLKFNKNNITARNLLGLVYFEMGEVVAALSEWVISKNIQPEDNIATEYIGILQKDANRLDTINQTIKKYNIALENCHNGNEDVAEIQLKKILAQNPKLVKAYHLLALLYIHKNQYEKARRLLRRAIQIDRTNTTTLRFIREVDSHMGTQSALEGTFLRWNLDHRENAGEANAQEGTPIIASYRPKRNRMPLLNLILGVVIGMAALWFLIVPALTRNINEAANEKITRYSADMASYTAQIDDLNHQIEDSMTTVSTANAQIEAANDRAVANENLLKAVEAYDQEMMDTAANALATVDSSLLSVEAKAVFDSLSENLHSRLFAIYRRSGLEAFGNSDFVTAIQQLEMARSLDDSDYDVLNYLAHAYRLNSDSESADKIYQSIIDMYPATQRAEHAQQFLSTSDEESRTTTTDELIAGAIAAAGDSGESEDYSDEE